jgi:hypothetical protein
MIPSDRTEALDCPHEDITTYRFSDEGHETFGQVALWACAACLRRFGPLAATPHPSVEADAAWFERRADLQDAIIEAVRNQDGVAGIKAFAAYEAAIRGAAPTANPRLTSEDLAPT